MIIYNCQEGEKEKTSQKKLKKTLDNKHKKCYNKDVPKRDRETGSLPPVRHSLLGNKKKLKKVLDKLQSLWYNKNVNKRDNLLNIKKIWVATYARRRMIL